LRAGLVMAVLPPAASSGQLGKHIARRPMDGVTPVEKDDRTVDDKVLMHCCDAKFCNGGKVGVQFGDGS